MLVEMLYFNTNLNSRQKKMNRNISFYVVCYFSHQAFHSAWAGETKPVSMTTVGQVLVLNANQTIQLECLFSSEDLDLFRNPMDTVVWKKIQKNEEVVMGKL